MVNQKQNKKSLKARLMLWLGLSNEVTIKLYHGYGYNNRLSIQGHVLKLGPKPRKKYRQSFLRNTWALLRLFIVKPYPNLEVQLLWKDSFYTCVTDKDGFFKFDWADDTSIEKGWREVVVQSKLNDHLLATSQGSIYVPYKTQYGFISDIDDTFLISHSSSLRKRLFVLFTENARSRKPFADVVRHYQLLAISNTVPEAPNPFFFVSSSEWNLYDYIVEFARVNSMPEGVFLLNQLKVFSQLLKTGQNNHEGKFTRITRILEHYPEQKFILLGDSSQQDPFIYEAIVSHFPNQICAVYIRDIYPKNHLKVTEALSRIAATGIPCCFFQNSSEAILHSITIGLIAEAQPV